MKPGHVVDEVRRRSRNRLGTLHFYWVAAPGDRDEFSQGLREEGVDLPLCPIVVRIGCTSGSSGLLFELDRELVRSLRASHERDHRLVNSFHEALRLESDGNIPFTELLSNADAALDRVTSPRDYRPSTVRNLTFVGRLWRLANTTPADGLGKVSKRAVNALDLSAAEVSVQHESIVTVLGRPVRSISRDIRVSLDESVNTLAARPRTRRTE